MCHIVGMHEIEGTTAGQLVRFVAQYALQRRACIPDAPGRIDHGDDVQRIFDQRTKVALACPQLFLRDLATRYIRHKTDQCIWPSVFAAHQIYRPVSPADVPIWPDNSEFTRLSAIPASHERNLFRRSLPVFRMNPIEPLFIRNTVDRRASINSE